MVDAVASADLGLHCYCGTPDFDEYSMLQCKLCRLFFHSGCLRKGRPSPLEGDVLFDFICAGCDPEGAEKCFRLKLQWSHVVILSLYNLQLQAGGKCGYVRWREHVCRFIDKNWTTFFGYCRKKTNTWHGTVAGVLSAGCPRLFTSGIQELKEPGWWSLTIGRPPSLQDYKDTTSGSASRNNRRATVFTAPPPLQNTISLKLPLPTEQPASESDMEPSISSMNTHSTSVPEENEAVSRLLGTDDDEETDAIDINPGSTSPVMPSSPSVENLFMNIFGKEGGGGQDSIVPQESESGEDEIAGLTGSVGVAPSKGIKRQRQHSVNDNESPEQDDSVKTMELVGISAYEEKRLLRVLEKLLHGKLHDAEARRFRRKLILRQQKRDRGLPLFDLNTALHENIRQTGWSNYVQDTSNRREFRILDRYRVGYSRQSSTGFNSTSFATKLVGSCGSDMEDIVSPYTTRILKPFIWRDYESQPPKWRILRDIAANRAKYDKTWTCPPMAPIDYRYVRPEYIPAINSICRQFFWHGIDLSESLHYPDFSCVALYRKVVIGFAFMVPDVKYNEAYISFVFTHPEWRGSGIATFMLYHLIQTCMGKDVTLHVSATNPALLLYQKFGFKLEEFVIDFYDKYFPIESKECKHAMFLRLSR